jgi:DNA primase
VRALVTELAVEPLHTRRDPDELYAGTQLVGVRLAAVNRRVAELHAQLRRLESGQQTSAVVAVQNELKVLQDYGRSLQDSGAAAL